ncbi:MAG: histidine phosphatase family protein [Frankia sp.]|nr:histidine phosphatase family protein [Frankia sp.]
MLLRHAKSDWAGADTPDHARPLSRDGREACRLVADHVRGRGLRPDLILCSAATRTRETLERIASALPADVPVLTEERLYLASADELLARLREVDDGVPTVLLVGHNPGIHELALGLLPSADRPKIPTFPTAALAVLDLGSRRWAELGAASARFGEFTTPKALRHAGSG